MAISDVFENLEIKNPRNLLVAVSCGFLSALAWWLVIDAACMYTTEEFPGAYHTPGVFGTIAFLLVNMIPNSALQDDFGDRMIGRRGAFACLFVAFLLSFSCVCAAAGILFGAYVAAQSPVVWPGVAVLLQNVFLCIAAFAYRFGRKDED